MDNSSESATHDVFWWTKDDNWEPIKSVDDAEASVDELSNDSRFVVILDNVSPLVIESAAKCLNNFSRSSKKINCCLNDGINKDILSTLFIIFSVVPSISYSKRWTEALTRFNRMILNESLFERISNVFVQSYKREELTSDTKMKIHDIVICTNAKSTQNAVYEEYVVVIHGM